MVAAMAGAVALGHHVASLLVMTGRCAQVVGGAGRGGVRRAPHPTGCAVMEERPGSNG
jgi:hypothetical protein